MFKKINYGVIIILTCFVMTFVFLGLGNSTLSLYVLPVTEEFGFSRGGFSLIFSIVSLVGMATALFFGVLNKKLGIRLVVGIGCALAAIAFFVFYKATTLPVFYLGATLLGVGVAVTSTLSISLLVNNWFKEKQGAILGIIFAGSGLGGTAFSIFMGSYILANGFSQAFLISAIILAVFVIPVALLLKDSPAKTVEESGQQEKAAEKIDGESTSVVIKKPGVIIGIVTFFLAGGLIYPLLTITPAILGDRGFDPVFSATIFGAVFLILTVSQIVIGIISDRFGIKIAMTLGLGCFIASSTMLLFTNTEWMAWMYAILYGTSFATLSVLLPIFTAKVVGNENLNNFIGIFMAFMSLGTIVGVPILGVAYDLLGSYNQIIVVYVGLGVLALILAMISLKASAKNSETGGKSEREVATNLDSL